MTKRGRRRSDKWMGLEGLVGWRQRKKRGSESERRASRAEREKKGQTKIILKKHRLPTLA